MRDSTSVQSLDRTFDILELLSKEQHGLNLTEIAQRLDLHKSTVYRLLAALRKRGYIEQSGNRGAYRIGMEFLELCSLYLNNLELKTEAAPFLRELSGLSTQTVYLATLQDGEVVYIDKVEQFNSLRKYSIIGQRRPAYCTSLGKALLSGMSDEEIRRLYPEEDLPVLTPRTIATVSALIEEIRTIRQRGWSFDDEEYTLGERCVGAPIFDYRDRVIAAVSTSWRIDSFRDARLDQIAGYVRDTASEISKRMGYREKWVDRRSAENFGYQLKLS